MSQKYNKYENTNKNHKCLSSCINIDKPYLLDDSVKDETAGAAAVSVLIKDKKFYCVSQISSQATQKLIFYNVKQ